MRAHDTLEAARLVIPPQGLELRRCGCFLRTVSITLYRFLAVQLWANDLIFLSLSFLIGHMGLMAASAMRSQGGRGGLMRVKRLEQRLARCSLPLPSGPGSLSLDAQVRAAQCPVCARVCCEMGDADTPPPPGGCVPTCHTECPLGAGHWVKLLCTAFFPVSSQQLSAFHR